MDDDTSWRLAMLVPAMMMLVVAVTINALCWDTPLQKRFEKSSYHANLSSSALLDSLRDPKVLIMAGQYAACFGTEVAMNNLLATHFRVYFEMSAGAAALLAGAFGRGP